MRTKIRGLGCVLPNRKFFKRHRKTNGKSIFAESVQVAKIAKGGGTNQKSA